MIAPIIANDVYIDPEKAKEYPGFLFQGEYTGHLYLEGEKVNIGLQVSAIGDNQFRALLYYEGLPGERSIPVAKGDKFELLGTYQEGSLELEGDLPFRFKFSHECVNVIDEENNFSGHLDKVLRVSPVDGMKPPRDAIVLFDGTNLEHWDENTEMTDKSLLKQGATTVKKFGDMHLHLEAKIGFIPHHNYQNRANSGIYIQNRYEVQILDTFSFPATINSNGSLYNEAAPRINASFPPLTWQTFDIFFRAPRFDNEGSKTENARVTVYMNGILIHDEVELEKGTGAGGQREEVPTAELYLQDHGGDPARFRNVWVVEGEPSLPGGSIGW